MLYGYIRRKLREKKRIGKIKELREEKGAKQQLHTIANEIFSYAKQFPKPIIVMEDLNGICNDFKKSKKLKTFSQPAI